MNHPLPNDLPTTFRISPLVRLTLLTLYLALTLPLPFLSQVTAAPVPAQWFWVAIGFGFLLLYGVLSERVQVDVQGIEVSYPRWWPDPCRRGWSLAWHDIAELKSRTTGQGGLVYYFVTTTRDRAYLLPMRVAGFARLTRIVQAQTAIDMQDVRPLSQPWMYAILLGCAGLLLLVDAWAIATALSASDRVAFSLLAGRALLD
ncbi:MAG: hypothetical protein HC838_09645 [Spirulinaceae cyanobacterium RM2_2_10]|nr:hypothetical protein [Spirulinaceae cyanobacterium SM2_1_0]NJO20245.1 hypothetical protein [Spirulinaceae cyanobacterium RM2_2_10]